MDQRNTTSDIYYVCPKTASVDCFKLIALRDGATVVQLRAAQGDLEFSVMRGMNYKGSLEMNTERQLSTIEMNEFRPLHEPEMRRFRRACFRVEKILPQLLHLLTNPIVCEDGVCDGNSRIAFVGRANHFQMNLLPY